MSVSCFCVSVNISPFMIITPICVAENKTKITYFQQKDVFFKGNKFIFLQVNRSWVFFFCKVRQRKQMNSIAKVKNRYFMLHYFLWQFLYCVVYVYTNQSYTLITWSVTFTSIEMNVVRQFTTNVSLKMFEDQAISRICNQTIIYVSGQAIGYKKETNVFPPLVIDNNLCNKSNLRLK